MDDPSLILQRIPQFASTKSPEITELTGGITNKNYKITVDEEGIPTQGMAEVIVAKHRNGSLDTVKLKFIGKYTKFADFDGPSGQHENPFSGMIRLESKVNTVRDVPPPPPAADDETPF